MSKRPDVDRLRPALTLLVLCVMTLACGHAPPSLSPSGVAAYQATQVVKVLDLVRDAAIAANNQTPPLVSTESTRKVVLFHRAALQTIRAVPGGWRPTVSGALTELEMDLPPPERARLAPYLALVRALIAEVADAH